MDCENIVEKIKPSIALVLAYKGKEMQGKGSGFVFSKKGLLVTCNHVVPEKDLSVFLKFPNITELFPAKVVIRDEEHDIALLKFENDTLEPLKKCDEEKIKEGMAVIFSGYPLSLFSLTTHQGILSAIIEDATGVKTYLIDGTVNSGNSGCPLMNKDGEVIGIVNAKRRERTDLLDKVEKMTIGAVSLHGVDLVEIYQAVIKNVQLGIGYAIPCSYIPEHVDKPKTDTHDNETVQGDNQPKK
jgi:S1-C subfamily serine protease